MEKIGTAMASPLRGVQGQPNIITCRTTAEMWQVDAARLMLDDVNNRMEKKIQTLEPRYLALKTETQLPFSD